MSEIAGSVLVLNAGSSSLKYQLVDPITEVVHADGIAERIYDHEGSVTHHQNGTEVVVSQPLPSHLAAIEVVLGLFADNGLDLADAGLVAVGHRVVHGGRSFFEPTLVTPEVIAEIDRISTLAPLHNPASLTGIAAVGELLPNVASVVVFDTAFFHRLPEAAATYAIDRGVAKLHAIRRYGFHGTSHRYVSELVPGVLGKPPAEVNQIVLHLGNGASASAISGGWPIDTSMGMTPLEGLVMGTRSGDIDPGAVLHLNRVANLDINQIDTLLNKRSGLLGLCGDSDFRAVTARVEQGDRSAILAYNVYIHRLRHYIGAYMVELGRVDAITFTAGVGENSPGVRADALVDLENYGIIVDPDRNAVRSKESRVISSDDSPVAVLVVPTNEELAIARQAAAVVLHR